MTGGKLNPAARVLQPSGLSFKFDQTATLHREVKIESIQGILG
jgi:hypothetical protein